MLIFGDEILIACSLIALLESKNATAFKIPFQEKSISVNKV
jgi:hypothetical protein